MDPATILVIAVALALDCFAVALAAGTRTGRGMALNSARMAAVLGVFQAGMLLAGWLAGRSVTVAVSGFGGWLAFALLAAVGVRMIRGGVAPVRPERASPPGTGTLLLLAVTTSLDALAVGASLALLMTGILLPCLVVGVSAFAISFLGAEAGGAVAEKWGKATEVLGGIVLIAVGIEMVVLPLTG